MFWNINGFTELLKSAEVSAWLYNNCDICFVTETHMTKGQKLDVKNFKCFDNPFSEVFVQRPRGGITCLIRTDCMQFVLKVDRSVPDNIFVRMVGGHTIFGTYIPPVDSPYYNDVCFTSIPNAFHGDDNKKVIIGGGDLNCRVGDISQSLPLLGCHYRANADREVNSHGRFLKKVCKSYSCFILNNLSIGEKNLDGDFTFCRGGMMSQNDLCLTNEAGLKNVEQFTIHKIGWNFSDHFPVSCEVKLSLYDDSIPSSASADILSEAGKCEKRQKKVASRWVDWGAYRTIAARSIELLNTHIDSLIRKPSTKLLNFVVDLFSDKLYKAAKMCEIKETEEVVGVAEPSQGMETATGVLHSFSSGLSTWEEWDDARKQSVKEISDKHFSKLIDQWESALSTNDSRGIWDKINWKGGFSDEDTAEKSPEPEQLASQFVSKDSQEEEHLLDIDFGKTEVPELDQEISREEITKSMLKLKEKSTADGWSPNMVTNFPEVLEVLFIIFNLILRHGLFPVKWWYSVVVALYKKGSRLLPKNFRPVSLVVMLLKLLDFTILDRFKKWFKPHDLQTAYQDGKGSGDHIFLLRCVIQLFNKDKRKLFITAIDFDGAFDRVKRSTLLHKLLKCGASSLFVLYLANLYSVSGNTIFGDDSHVLYMLYSGIKQGLPLSPYLFLFYINDVFDFLDSLFSGDCSTDIYGKLHILIHADDANLLACTRRLMIEKLRSMMEFCVKNSIILQYVKCHFTVVNGDDDDISPLNINEKDKISFTEYLEILGSHISSCLKFDLELHMKKRFKNVIKFFNYIRMNPIAPISIRLKVLNACVMSTLLYNCETWGPHVPEGLEEVYHKMLRVAMGVRANCPTLPMLIESSCLPLRCLIQMRQFNFFQRFKDSLQPNSCRQSVFNDLLKNSTDFLQHYVDLETRYADSNSIEKHHMEVVRNKIKACANNKEKHYKYWIYLENNPELIMSPFLNRIDSVGKSITKFRLGSHNLAIETGRWCRRKREDRLCNTCNLLGDENHAVFSCSKIERSDLLELPETLSAVWEWEGVNILFKRLRDAEMIG